MAEKEKTTRLQRHCTWRGAVHEIDQKNITAENINWKTSKINQSNTSETRCSTGTSSSSECLSNENRSSASPKKIPVLRISKKTLEILEPRPISSSKVPQSLPTVTTSLSAKNTPSKSANPQEIEYIGFMNVHECPNNERNKHQRLLTTLTFPLAKEIKCPNKWLSSNDIDCVMYKLAFLKERSDITYFFQTNFINQKV